jgi:hypothetical protein
MTSMRFPYVIDNETHRMVDVNDVLATHASKSLDVATAYFNVQGFRLLQPGLLGLGSFRLLLGDEPTEGANLGLRPRAATALSGELEAAPYCQETLRAVEDLIALRQSCGELAAPRPGNALPDTL